MALKLKTQTKQAIAPQQQGGPGGRDAEVAVDGQEAAVILAQARAQVDPELRRAVETLPTALRRIARYHFGWEQADGTAAAGHAGKAIRPALVLAAVRALGALRSPRCGRRRPWNSSTTSRSCTTT